MAKKDSALAEIGNMISRTWRHRKAIQFGDRTLDKLHIKIKVPIINKTVYNKKFYIDNEIPGKIMDCFEQLGLVNRDKEKPQEVWKHKREDGTWDCGYTLPAGVYWSKIRHYQDNGAFSDVLRKYVEMRWENYMLHVTVHNDDLPDTVLFNFDPRPYLDKMALPWLIGFTHGNTPIVEDLAKFPHALCGGATGFGKSTLVRSLIFCLLQISKYAPGRVKIAVADLKGLDFYMLSDYIMVIESEEDVYKALQAIWREHERRKKIFRKCGIKKIQQYKGDDLPYLVFAVDEFAEIKDKDTLARINQTVRICRATGIHLVIATQRPSIVGGVMDGDTRGQLTARVAFKCACEADSRMILGEAHNEAAWLQGNIQGRAFFNFGVETKMLQTMLITDEIEQNILAGLSEPPKWDFGEHKKLLPK